MEKHDLTGIWQGLYSYGSVALDVGFTATLLESGGAVFGTTHEFDPRLAPVDLDASLTGNRAGRRVNFTKTYAADGDDFRPIAYAGTLNGEGTEVEGNWTIEGLGLSGRFLMSRPTRRAEEARAERARSAASPAPVITT